VREIGERFDSKASAQTKDIIRRHYEKALPGLVGSDLFKVQLADYLQAEAHKQETLRKVGRNDLCPCGSGKKFKDCHGA